MHRAKEPCERARASYVGAMAAALILTPPLVVASPGQSPRVPGEPRDALVLRGEEPVAPIGRPLAHTRYWVLDAQGGLLPRGAVGELCIGGSGLAAGYWNREAQTAERFVELEIAGRRERVYRSGDRVRWNEHGQLVFVGRTDHQVKVRGYRIELGEIEAALQSCIGVTGAVVKVEDDNTLLVDIAKDVRVRVARGTISEVLSKPQTGAAPAARAETAAGTGAKSGLMSQLFGKK